MLWGAAVDRTQPYLLHMLRVGVVSSCSDVTDVQAAEVCEPEVPQAGVDDCLTFR